MFSDIGARSRASSPQAALAVAAGLAATVFIMVPWLNPFAPGPSTTLMPWLTSLACAAFLILLAPVLTVRRVARAWLAAALASAVIGLMQYAGAVQWLYPWVNLTVAGEAFGNLRQRNQFASLMNIGLAALVWEAGRRHADARFAQADSGERRAPANCIGWCLPLAAALLAAANAASASRTGLLQLVLLGGLCLLWRTWRVPGVARLLAAAAVVYLLAACLLPLVLGLAPLSAGVFARIADDSQPCSSRIALWSNVLHLIAQKPWTGWGWGELDYAHFATLYPDRRFCDILDNAHDLPLHLAVELGLPVALAACGALAWVVWRARPWRETRPVRQLAWTVIVLIGVHSLLEYPLWYGPFFTAVVLCAGLLWTHPAADASGASSSRHPTRAGWRFPPPLAARAAVALLLLGALAYTAWDYRRISQLYTAPEARLPAYKDDTLGKARASWLFADQVRFAELTMAPVSRANAPAMYRLASSAIHYSPEPAVIERLIESAVMLGRDDEAIFYLARYKAAFPKEHAAWAAANLRAVRKTD